MIEITYFVHGSTQDNIDGKYTGWYDIDLAPLGVEQSTQLREYLSGTKFDVVISSDLTRAMKSAIIAFDGTPLITDQLLRECNLGDFDRYSAAVIDPIMKDHIDKPFPNGESYRDVEMRMRGLLLFINENYPGKRVALVGHRAPQLALDVILKGKTWEQAIAEDWRHCKSDPEKGWKPGWEYKL